MEWEANESNFCPFITGSNRQGLLPTTTLESLVIHTSCVSDVHMDDTANMKCKIYHLHLEHYFIQQKHDQNLQHLC